MSEMERPTELIDEWNSHSYGSEEKRLLAWIKHLESELANTSRVIRANKVTDEKEVPFSSLDDQLTSEDLNRARTFITQPSLCEKYALIEWMEALLKHIDNAPRVVRSDRVTSQHEVLLKGHWEVADSDHGDLYTAVVMYPDSLVCVRPRREPNPRREALEQILIVNGIHEELADGILAALDEVES